MIESVAAQIDAAAAQQYYLTLIKDINLSNEKIIRYNAVIEENAETSFCFLIK